LRPHLRALLSFLSLLSLFCCKRSLTVFPFHLHLLRLSWTLNSCLLHSLATRSSPPSRLPLRLVTTSTAPASPSLNNNKITIRQTASVVHSLHQTRFALHGLLHSQPSTGFTLIHISILNNRLPTCWSKVLETQTQTTCAAHSFAFQKQPSTCVSLCWPLQVSACQSPWLSFWENKDCGTEPRIPIQTRIRMCISSSKDVTNEYNRLLLEALLVTSTTTVTSTTSSIVASSTTLATSTVAATTAATTTAQTTAGVPTATAAVAAAGGNAPTLSTSVLTAHGFSALGQNSYTNNGACWIGGDGPNTNVMTNGAGEDIIVVVWGPFGSWMTGGSPPLITYALGPGQSVTVSCADNVPGGWAAVYQSMVNSGQVISAWGQVDNTWGEFTYGSWGTYDVSREINMSGRPMSIVGPSCTSNMGTCVFVCFSGNSCGTAGSYQLQNCNAGNGGGSDAAAMNGGCTSGSNLHLQTTFS
jgi:hypothetical protein